jgi:hypothetical protein
LFFLFEDRVELRAGHLQLLGMFVDPLGESVVLGRRPTSFEFCAVLSQTIQFEVESIFEIGEFGRDDCLLGEDGRDKDHTIGFGQDKIAREDGATADSNER